MLKKGTNCKGQFALMLIFAFSPETAVLLQTAHLWPNICSKACEENGACHQSHLFPKSSSQKHPWGQLLSNNHPSGTAQQEVRCFFSFFSRHVHVKVCFKPFSLWGGFDLHVDHILAYSCRYLHIGGVLLAQCGCRRGVHRHSEHHGRNHQSREGNPTRPGPSGAHHAEVGDVHPVSHHTAWKLWKLWLKCLITIQICFCPSPACSKRRWKKESGKNKYINNWIKISSGLWRGEI